MRSHLCLQRFTQEVGEGEDHAQKDREEGLHAGYPCEDKAVLHVNTTNVTNPFNPPQKNPSAHRIGTR